MISPKLKQIARLVNEFEKAGVGDIDREISETTAKLAALRYIKKDLDRHGVKPERRYKLYDDMDISNIPVLN